MDLGLAGKRALVTGSTAGIGKAIAAALAAEGAEVIVNGRDAGRVAAVCAELRSAGGVAQEAPFDLGLAEGCAALLAAQPEVDILVNNLGIFEPKPFEEIPDADWFRFFEVNVMSGVRLARHYFPRMKARGFGRVIFISSESALATPAEMIHYGMTKTAQLALSRGLAETTTGTSVTVNAVLPGPTRTEGVERFMADLAARAGVPVEAFIQRFFAEARPTSILKRLIEPAEVAAAVAFLASPLAAAINGAAVRVEGGVVRTIA